MRGSVIPAPMIRLALQFLVWLLRALWLGWLLALPRPLLSQRVMSFPSNIHMNTEDSTGWRSRNCMVRRTASNKGGMVCAGLGLGRLTWDGAQARTI